MNKLIIPARKSVLDDFVLTQEEEAVLFYRNHPIEACRDLILREPVWFQRTILKKMWTCPLIVMKLGRGASKSSLIAMYLTLRGMLFPDIKMGVFGPAYRQAKRIYEEIMIMYNNSPYIRSCIKKNINSSEKFRIDFYSGSYIEGIPLGETGGKARGQRYNILAIDEYVQLNERIFRETLRPMLSIQTGSFQNQLIRSSSAWYRHNHFFQLCRDYEEMMARRPDEYFISSYNIIDILLARHKNFKPDLKMAIDGFREDPAEIFLMEWFGIFPLETDGFFSSQLIDSCILRDIHKIVPIEVKGDPSAEYTMGVDPARSSQGANFAISILKLKPNGTREIVKVFTARGMKFPEMADQIRSEIFINGFNVVDLRIDSRGGGMELKDLLERPWIHDGKEYPPIIEITEENKNKIEKANCRPILHMIDWSAQNINSMYFRLKSDMEQQNILFPIPLHRDEDYRIETIDREISALRNEMQMIIVSPIAHGLKFEVPKGKTKDRVSALVMANQAAAEIQNIALEEKQSRLEDMLSLGGWV